MEQEQVVDCMVLLDGQNKPFFSYMNYEEALRLQSIGLTQAETVLLRETTDRQIPESLKIGETQICDVLVRLEPNCAISLN